MKIDYDPEDEISILENKERSEYYHKSKEMYKQMEEYFLMSVLKCDRTVTQLSPLDKTIVLINKINTILFPHFDKLVLDEELNNIDNTDLLSVKEMFSNDFKTNNFKQDLTFYREQIDKYMRNLRKTIQKTLRYQYTKSYEGKMRRYNAYIATLDIIDNFIATLNEMSNKFKNIIWSLTPYVIFIENIKEKFRIKHYCRYNDDILIIHNSKTYLEKILSFIINYLNAIELSINAKKTRIFSISKGFNILKVKYFYDRYKNNGKVIMLSGRESAKRERRKLRKLKTKYLKNEISKTEILNLFLSWSGNILKSFNAYNLYKQNYIYFKKLIF